MSLLILIHKTKMEDMLSTSLHLFEKIKEQYPEQLSYSYNRWFFDVGSDIKIIFRSGGNLTKVAGLRPDCYYSDNIMMRDRIAQGAAKIGWKEIRDVDHVLSIISSYMSLKQSVDDILS